MGNHRTKADFGPIPDHVPGQEKSGPKSGPRTGPNKNLDRNPDRINPDRRYGRPWS